MNRRIIIFGVILVAFALQCARGQAAKKDIDLFKLPGDYSLAVAMIQKDSPVQFEGIDVLVDGTGTTPYLNWTLKNNSSKTVRRFVVAFKIRTNVEEWRGEGKGVTSYDIGTNEATDLMRPYGIRTENTYTKSSVVPIGIRKLFERKNESEQRKYVIVFGMISRVVFSDGSVYQADSEIFREF